MGTGRHPFQSPAGRESNSSTASRSASASLSEGAPCAKMVAHQADSMAADVVQALQSQNRLVPAGRVGGAPAPDGQPYTFTVQLQGRLLRNEDFENLVLRNTADGGLVQLKDVGRVTLGGETYDITATDLQGVPAGAWRCISSVAAMPWRWRMG